MASGTLDGDPAALVSVNYYGAVAALNGLRPLLEQASGASAVVLGGTAVTTTARYPLEIAEWCLADDEAQARAVAAGHVDGVYASTALALTLWARRNAADWRRHGVRLNVAAPGLIDGPATEAWARTLDAGALPLPTGRVATPDDVAAVVAFLLSDDAAYVNGAVLPVDGGTEAELRSDDWPRPIGY